MSMVKAVSVVVDNVSYVLSENFECSHIRYRDEFGEVTIGCHEVPLGLFSTKMTMEILE